MTPENKITGYAGLIALVIATVLGLAGMLSCADADAASSPWRYSLATQYGSKHIGDPLLKVVYDKQAGAMFACGGAMDPLKFAIANRTLRCGTVVEICRKTLCVLAKVWDSGPFHAVPVTCGAKWSQRCWDQGRTIAKRRLPDGYAWRFANDLDLLPRVAWAIRLGGKAVVRWRVVHIPKRKRRR